MITRRLAAIFIFLALLSAPTLVRAESDFEAAEILFTQAVLAYDDGNYAQATRDLLKAHALDPGNVNVIYYLGLTYNAQGNFAEAARYLSDGLRLQPKNLDLRYELGVSLYGQKLYDDALKEFLAILAADPHKDNAGYYAGLCYYQKKDYESAVTHFRRNVSTDIKTRQQNQYYLGLALRDLGRDAEAIEELNEVVKIAPASPIVGSTQQLLTTIREETGGKRLRLEATLNVQYDTNPDYGRRPTGSWGNLFNARADYVVYKAGPWESTVSYSFLQTVNYQNHHGDINDNLIGANLYYRGTFAGMATISGVQFNNDVLFFGGDLFLQRPTATFTFIAQENLSNFTTLIYRPQYKDFLQGATTQDERRNAFNNMLGFIHSVRLAGGHQFNFGFQFDRDDARGSNWRYNGYKPTGGLLIKLPWEVRWNTNFEYHARFYPTRNTLFLKHRVDHQPTVFTELRKDITPNLSAHVQYFYDRNLSTVTDFNIRREVYALGLTWRY